jgi:hypothetical protein
MRRPARARPVAKEQIGTVRTVPAPVKGWNARDPIARMDPLYASVMDNVIPRSSDVTLRPGCEDHVTGIVGTVKSLMPYGAIKLFGATDTGIFDVTATGVVGAAVAAVTDGAMIHENFSTAGVAYLYAVNGIDKPWLYNGTTWTAMDAISVPALTGVTTTDINFVKIFKQRLWFLLNSSTSAYYLAAGAIAGALIQFDVGAYLSRGGYLIAMGNWSFDGGNGPDDYVVFITSEGEAVIYKGTDPATAATWALVGVYYVGVPLGAKCLCKFGGDLLYLCTAGAMPLSKLLLAVSIDRNSAITSNIDNAFVSAVEHYKPNYGWEAQFYTTGSILVVNIPSTVDGSYNVQYVMNTVTGGWCRFLGWPASCFAVYNEELYYGMSTKVVKAFRGTADFAANITGVVQQAYNYFGGAFQKHWTLVRPILITSDTISVSLGLDVDFDLGGMLSTSVPAVTGAATYDTSVWDTGLWGPDNIVSKDWRTIAAKVGFCAAFRMQITTKSVEVSWQATDFLFKPGAVL